MADGNFKSFLVEEEISLPSASIQIISVPMVESREYRPPLSSYYVSQRISYDHKSIVVGNNHLFPRVYSVGVLLPGGSYHVGQMENPFRSVTCVFDKNFFEKETDTSYDMCSENIDLLMKLKNKNVEKLMMRVRSEIENPKLSRNFALEALASLIVVEIGRHWQGICQWRREGGVRFELLPWQLRKVEERLQASSDMGYPSLSELAGLCKISQSHFMRSFKASTGWPIHKYIAERRLEEAKLLLVKGRLPCKEIAARLGFRSSAYFSSAFRQMTGESPIKFRHRNNSG